MKRIANIQQPMIGFYHLPVVLVSCATEGGKPNIIPLGWAGGVCSEPPQVGVSLRPKRYSHELIQSTGDFVVNIPTEELVRTVDATGFCSGRDVDKFECNSLTPLPAKQIKSPLIKECSVNLECQLRRSIDLGSHTLFIGEILFVHADEDLLTADGQIDFPRLRPIVLKHDEYCGMTEPLGWYGFTEFKERVVNKVF